MRVAVPDCCVEERRVVLDCWAEERLAALEDCWTAAEEALPLLRETLLEAALPEVAALRRDCVL